MAQTEVEFAICDCCWLKEECTPAYMERYHGKWICGLCAEAIKDEIVGAERLVSTEEAMVSQAHELLQEVQFPGGSSRPCRPPDLSHEAAFEEEPGVQVEELLLEPGVSFKFNKRRKLIDH